MFKTRNGCIIICNLALTLLYTALCLAPAHAAVIFDWATVGNPGNADDTHDAGYGGVAYAYRIGKHEVTNAQYTEFLNAVDPTGANSLSLYNSNMSSNARGGINMNVGVANGSKYQIKAGRNNNPVIYVSFFDAMRFVNWLHNGQGSGDTETGAYTIGSGTNEVRSAGAKYWIPSEDEWYKAAYYDPSGVYYDYPTRTDAVPYADNPGALNTLDDTNVANIFADDGVVNGYDDGYAVTGSAVDVDSTNYLTDVGAYSLTTSPYGTFDQGGNVAEWNDTVIINGPTFRGVRGGSWNNYSGFLRADQRGYTYPSGEGAHRGFRIAGVPEPSTLDFLWGLLLVLVRRSRRPAQ